MGDKLPKYGLQLEIAGWPIFQKTLDAVNKKIEGAVSTAKDAASKASAPIDKTVDSVGKSIDNLKGKLTDFIKTNVPFGDALGGIIDKLGAIPVVGLAAAAGIAAVTGAVVAFIALGNRGSSLTGLADSFDHLTASVQLNSQTLLKDLRTASAGTISDFDLIRGANKALVGQVGVFGKAFGESLPRLLEIARASARATGEDINYLYDSIVTGVKRGSPKILDNLGIIINATEANDQYAKSIGVSADSLTEEQKKVAYLNATLEAGQTIIDANAGAHETAAIKIARAQATITNILDGLAVAVQPVYEGVLDGVQKILNAFSGFVPYLGIIFQFVGKIVKGIVDFLGQIIPPDLPKRLFEGAAAAFGSFANGIIAVANKLIFPAVIGIAKFVADFLIGFSPPKKGPLSVIDQGGANVMMAWLDGIAGVSLDPVEQVAQEVSNALGAIGKESLTQVNARLAQLDKALLPFQNRLDIVKANFDALAEPAKAALDAIDRQEQQLQAALAQGDPEAAARLRLLDQQRDAIQGQLDAQQAIVDNATVQLALAKAQQGPERALLTIRQAYLESLAKAQAKAAPHTGDVTKPEKDKQGSGSSPVDQGAGSGAPTLPGGIPNVLDTINGGQASIDTAMQGIQDAFSGQIDTSNMQDFLSNSLDLGTQIDRIKSVDLGSKLKDKFKGFTDIFDPSNPDSIPAKVTGFVSTLTGGPEVDGSVAHFFSNMGSNIEGAKNSVSTAVSGIADLFNPSIQGSPASTISQQAATLFGGVDTDGSIVHFFATLPDNLDTAKPAILAGVTDFASSLFDPKAPGSPAALIVSAVATLTGDQTTADSIASMFAEMPGRIGDATSTLLDDLQTKAFQPVADFLNGDQAGGLNDIINQAINLFAGLGPGIVGALQNFGGMVYGAVVVPIINVLNAAIGAVEGAVRGIAGKFAEVLGGIIGGFDNATIAGTNLGGLVPQSIRDFQANLAGVGKGFTIGRISTALPSFLQAPGGATGGIFSKGFMKVGERGPEYMYNASKMGVVPNDLVRVIGDLSTILAQPAPLPIGGSNYNDDHSSMINNFYGVQNGSDAIRRFAQLRASR